MSENYEPATREQLNLLNAACGDLSTQIDWHGYRLSKDDWRHVLSGTVLGWRLIPGVDTGEGPHWIMLGDSSLKLKKKQCNEAIELAFSIGDHPQSQGLKCRAVRWCSAVIGARYIVEQQQPKETNHERKEGRKESAERESGK